MRLTLIFLLCSVQLLVNAQSKFKNISTLDHSSAKVKILMLGADWCTICQANETQIEKKHFLSNKNFSEVSFFKLNENYPNPIYFNGKVYLFEQIGFNQGTHQLVRKLFNESETSYPTFLFLDTQNHLIESWSGFINESEIESILNGILNQVDAPDSVKSI